MQTQPAFLIDRDSFSRILCAVSYMCWLPWQNEPDAPNRGKFLRLTSGDSPVISEEMDSSHVDDRAEPTMSHGAIIIGFYEPNKFMEKLWRMFIYSNH